MERLTELIEQYREKSPPPTFGYVAQIIARFDEFESGDTDSGLPSGIIAPINVALDHVYAEGDVELIADYGIWLWIEAATRQGERKRTETDLLLRVFGSAPKPCTEPLFATIVDSNREFKLWRKKPNITPNTCESVSDPNQRPVLSLHVRYGKVSHMGRITGTIIKRCKYRWGKDFQLWISSDSSAQCA